MEKGVEVAIWLETGEVPLLSGVPWQMSFLDMFRTKTPAEQLRENKRMIDRSIRELDRERMKFEAQEKKTVAEMKKLAKAGQKVKSALSNRLPYQLLFVGCL